MIKPCIFCLWLLFMYFGIVFNNHRNFDYLSSSYFCIYERFTYIPCLDSCINKIYFFPFFINQYHIVIIMNFFT